MSTTEPCPLQKILERHGGAIEAKGEPGLRASFTITLPLQEAKESI